MRAPRIAAARDSALAAGIAAATLLAFVPVARNAFIELDDAAFITNNPHVREGLTLAGARWALTSLEQANWYPLTWLAHMLVVQLGGLDAGFHHLASLFVHVAAALLLFFALRAMTGAAVTAAFAAALFALHPLRVESVAWAAELKDVLSGCLYLLAVLAHVRYARRPGAARAAVTAGVFALALASKPMAVSLPFALLLLDYWPLGRWRPDKAASGCAVVPFTSLLREKLPLLALAAADGAITLVAQGRAGAVKSLDTLPLAGRVANAVVSLATYLERFLWPSNLAVVYPLGGDALQPAKVVAAGALLAAFTAVALWQARRRPYLAAGWLWFLVVVAPVSGIVQAGAQGMADRYTYLPLIGIVVALVWGARDLRRRLRPPAALTAAAAAAALLVLGLSTRAEIGYWRDGATLFDRACAVTEGNWFAAYNAGVAYARQGRTREAVDRYRASLAIRPFFTDAWLMLGNALARQGDLAAAEDALRRALAGPHAAEAGANLGLVLLRAGRAAEAAERFQAALRLRPDLSAAREGLARALALSGR
jgi:tetratricopeptide (TPR) repeat protein